MMKTLKHTIKNIVLMLFLGFLIPVSAQQTPVKLDKDLEKLINEGLKSYDRANYEDAELSFRKALAKDPMNAVASYNLGLTETELDKNLEAAHFFEKAAKTANDALLKSKAYFNQGNVWYQKKKYEKAIEAYKNALRQNPDDEEARYNLALAQMKLKKQQKKNKNNKNKKNNKKNKQNKQNKNQQNKQNKKQNKKNKDQQKNKGNQNKKDQNKKDQKNKDKNGKGDKKKNEKGKPKDNKQNKQGQQKDQQKQQNGKNSQKKQQPKQGEGQKRKVKLTPQQVKQLLVALKNKEQKTQKKIKAKILRGRGKKHKQDKDW